MAQNSSHGQLTSQVNLGNIPRNGFDLTYSNYFSGRLGKLYVTRKQTVYPNDNLKTQSNVNVQFKPLAVPILNNMRIKQEHFYVPFNVIWENFDEFISGGEELDYDGAVPSISLADMWSAFYRTCNTPELNSLKVTAATDANATGNTPFIGVSLGHALDLINTKLEYLNIKDIADGHMMLDLFDHVLPAIHAIGNYLESAIQSGTTFANLLPLFSQGYIDGVAYADFNNNKYMKKLEKSLVAYVESKYGDAYGYSKMVYPTEAGMAVLHYMYELIKPFFGIGSNLDMLGYNKLRFQEFLYLCLCSMIDDYSKSMVQSGSTYTIAIEQNMLSDMPERILELRALYSIWANNYRDQLIETDFIRPKKTDAITDLEIFSLIPTRVRCWHKDAFTTSLDSPGTGNVGVPIHNSNFQAVQPQDALTMCSDFASMNPMQIKHQINISNPDEFVKYWSNGNDICEVSFGGESYKIPTAFLRGINQPNDDTTSYTGAFSLYALDAAQRAQKWLQKALFYGNRIQDFLFTHFGVKFLDARLRLPELVQTSENMVNINAVVNPTNIKTEYSETIAGDRAAIAYGGDETSTFDLYCPEHGLFISLMSIIPDVTYSNSYNRALSVLDQFDFPFHEFATLGLQAVYDCEMSQIPVKVFDDYSNSLTSQPKVHGYQGMYYSDKYNHSEEHGDLLDTEDMYTFARDFNMYDPDGRPKLNYIFIHCHPTLDMFVVDDEFSSYFRCDVVHSYGVDRNLPAHSIYIN